MNTSDGVFSGEGRQYVYYATGGSKQKNTTDGNATSWWTRSPMRSLGNHSAYIKGDGGYYYDYTSKTLGVSFAFCF